VNLFPVKKAAYIRKTDDDGMPIRAEEWAWNIHGVQKDFLYRDGKMYKVFYDDAIEIWIWKLFQTERYQWSIHSLLYGEEYHTLIGMGYTPGYINSLAEEMTRDTLRRNLGLYVLDIQPIDDVTPLVTFYKGALYISFYADTIYNSRGVLFNGVYNSYL